MTEPATPRPAATLVLLRDSDHGLETLLLERTHNVTFVPGAHVFPGGAVDHADHDAAHDPHVRGHDDASASQLLGVESGGRAYFVAAVRECIEEAGVLIATTSDGARLPGDHPAVLAVPELRHQIEAGTVTIPDVCNWFDLVLDLEPVRYLSRWVTPEESPRRYDAHFFVAPMPAEQVASADGWEATDASWWTPAAALDTWRAERMTLIEPTVRTLDLLADFETVDGVLDALDHGQGRPRIRDLGGERVTIPTDRLDGVTVPQSGECQQ